MMKSVKQLCTSGTSFQRLSASFIFTLLTAIFVAGGVYVSIAKDTERNTEFRKQHEQVQHVSNEKFDELYERVRKMETRQAVIGADIEHIRNGIGDIKNILNKKDE